MNVIWNKVFRDLAQNRNRTMIIILSTMIGVYALGLVFGLSDHLIDHMAENQRMSNPSHVVFQGGMFSKGFVDAVSEQKMLLRSMEKNASPSAGNLTAKRIGGRGY